MMNEYIIFQLWEIPSKFTKGLDEKIQKKKNSILNLYKLNNPVILNKHEDANRIHFIPFSKTFHVSPSPSKDDKFSIILTNDNCPVLSDFLKQIDDNMRLFTNNVYKNYVKLLIYLNELVSDTWLEFNENDKNIYEKNFRDLNIKIVSDDETIHSAYPNVRMIFSIGKPELIFQEDGNVRYKTNTFCGSEHIGFVLTKERVWKRHSWMVFLYDIFVDRDTDRKLIYLTFDKKPININFKKN